MSSNQPVAHPWMANSLPDIKQEMLRAIGARSIEELFLQIPADHRLSRPIDLPPALREEPVRMLSEGDAFPYRPEMSLTELETEHIRRALIYHARNTTRAAKSLGISRSTLWRKMKQYML